jgi:subtilisin family serine protease
MRSIQESPPPAPPPSDELRIALTLPAPDGSVGPTKRPVPLSAPVLDSIAPDAATRTRAVDELAKRGFRVSAEGRLSISLRASKDAFEQTFRTQLATFSMNAAGAQFGSVLFPAPGLLWAPDPMVGQLIDDAYIQWPHIYMTNRFGSPPLPSPVAPLGTPHHLNVADVAMLLNADKAHREGITGKGITVAMIDTGFAHGHPYFTERAYNTSTILAPGADYKDRDGNGHGTGESANLLAIAPDVTFIGIKLENETDPRHGASMLGGIQEALRHRPRILSLSLGYDLCGNPRLPLPTLPNALKALEAEIQSAVASGVIVVFSSGNGHVSFPGMMPEVISAGGVYIDAAGAARASDYASAFRSLPYPNRSVPDFCGLVGMQPNAPYIMLPIPAGCAIDRSNSAFDGTTASDGWAAFSGTSAAAPQIAGVCALLLQRNPGLTPADVKNVLRRTAFDVQTGSANAASTPGSPAMTAGPGIDDATGSGLVDAWAALKQV